MMWKGVVVLFSLLAVTLAFQAIAPLEPKPDKFKDQPGCYVSKLEQVLPLGKAGSRAPRSDSEECREYSCREHHIIISGSRKFGKESISTFLKNFNDIDSNRDLVLTFVNTKIYDSNPTPVERKPLDGHLENGCHFNSEGKHRKYHTCHDSHYRCSPVAMQPPCAIVVQRDKPYPACCPHPKCP